MTNTNGTIRTDKCAKICSNKTSEGYCKSTTCILPWTAQNDTVSNFTIDTSTYTYPRQFGECCCCEHREVCKFKDDFEEARNKLLEKNKNLPILKIECMYYQSRGLNITYANNGEPYIKPPYEFTCSNSDDSSEATVKYNKSQAELYKEYASNN